MNEKDWDAVARRFEKEIFNVPANDRRGLIAERVERFSNRNGAAADLGCGIGRTLPTLSKHFARVHAVEFSSECLAIAQHKYRRLKNVHYLHADLAARPVPIPAADLVLCINTLLIADLRQRMAMLEHVCRCVGKGGHLLLVVPAIESVLLTRHRRLQWDLRDATRTTPSNGRYLARMDEGVVLVDDVPTKHFLKEELQDLLTARGLKVEEVLKIEYDWRTEFAEPPRWMKAPYPWDWLVSAKRAR